VDKNNVCLPPRQKKISVTEASVAWSCNGSGSDWWPKGPRYLSRPVHCQVTTLDMLFKHTRASVIKQYNLVSGQRAVTLSGWEGNRGLGGKYRQPTTRFMTMSPAGWLPRDWDQLRPGRSLLSIGYIYLYLTEDDQMSQRQKEKHRSGQNMNRYMDIMMTVCATGDHDYGQFS